MNRPLNMAQSDSFYSSSNDDRSEQVTGVPAFWPKPTIKPRFLWRDWIDMFHMAADLKYGCYTRTLLKGPGPVITEPFPKPEKPEQGESDREKADREARDQIAILKQDALNDEIKRRGPKLANGIYYHEVEVRIRARLFLALGKEGQRRFKQKHPKVEIHSTTFRDFSKLLKDLFEAEVNVTYERIILFTRNQKKGESLESFHATLTEQATRCELGGGDLEKGLIKDLFVAKMTSDSELQKKFIVEKTSPEEVLKQIEVHERGAAT